MSLFLALICDHCPVKRTERLHAMSELLRRRGARGCTAQRLAAEFGVSVRTVKRDLAALEHSGTPIWSRPGPGGGYGLAGRTSLPPISLTPAQAVALFAAVSAAPDAPYSDLAAAAVAKIVDVLDPATRAKAHELALRVWVNAGPPTLRTVRSAVEEALADQRVVRIRFTDKEGVTTTRDVEPVVFASANGEWHLIGWCRLRNAIRWFRMARIDQARVTADPCTGHTIDEIGTPPPSSRPVDGLE